MENLSKIEFISFFSPELLTCLGIIINLILYMFFANKTNCKKLSDIITCAILTLNSVILFFLLNNIFKYGFCISNNSLFVDSQNIEIKLYSNIFTLIFVLITYKLNRRAKYRVPILNSSLLLMLLAIDIFSLSTNLILPFVMLDIISFLLYKRASFLKQRTKSIFDLNFIVINILASALFYGFYIAKYIVNNALMTILLDVFLSVSLLLKVGIFPLFNYQNFKNFRLNLPYSILLNLLLPYCGIIAFGKIYVFLTTSSEVYLMSMVTFLTATMFCFALFAFRTKNLVTLTTNINYFICTFGAILIVFQTDFSIYHKMLTSYYMIFLAFYSLISISKINLKTNQITFTQINGSFLNNRFYATMCTIAILLLCSVIPNRLTSSTVLALKEIYLYDKNSILLIAILAFCTILIGINLIKLIQNLYTFKKESLFNQIKKYTKKTTLNYVVSLAIFLILIFVL